MASVPVQEVDGAADARSEKTSLIDLLTAYEPDGLSEAEAMAFKTFLSELYGYLPHDELVGIPVDRLRAMAMSFWQFAAKRDQAEEGLKSGIRLYNPTMKSHGWDASRTVIEVVTDDRPFLVASVLAELNERELEIEFLAHPVVTVRRDAEGNRVYGDDGEGVRESRIHIQIQSLPTPNERKEIEAALDRILRHVSLAVGDWREITAHLNETIDQLQSTAGSSIDEHFDESIQFLQWLSDDHFLFLGARDYVFEGSPETGELLPVAGTSLGILKEKDVLILRRSTASHAISPEVHQFWLNPTSIIVSKSNFKSLVHRRAYLDYIGVKLFSETGSLVGERRFLGLFTSAAYNRSTHAIPLIRRKTELITERAGFTPGSHDGNALLNVIENYPRDELFQVEVEELARIAVGVLRLTERPRTRVFLRHDKFDRFCSALVFVPRERFTSELREDIGECLADAFSGRISAYYTQITDGPLARVHFVIGRDPGVGERPSDAKIEQMVTELVRSWSERLREELVERFGALEGPAISRRYKGAFTEAYKEAFGAANAGADIEIIETLTSDQPFAIRCYRQDTDPENGLRLKVYHEGEAITLTESMPMLENLGLRVVYEFAYDAHPVEKDATDGARGTCWIHDFYAEVQTEKPLTLEHLADVIEPAIRAIWRGDAEDDGFNRLVVSPGIHWRDVAILRACAKYRIQTGAGFSQKYMEEALFANPQIAIRLVELFKIRFEPEIGGAIEARNEAAGEIADIIVHLLEQVESLDQDRIIRRLMNIIESIVRTNFFQLQENGQPKSYISFKLNARAVEELPEPKPYAEIFVYSPRVEGVHLRGGPVARGGLRWSDRREDFRTEVLGLVKAQQVKNAVIVPQGAKGGFFPKQLPVGGTRAEMREEAVASYKLFISGLLDVTDNLPPGGSSDDVTPPPNVVRFDGDDPYLVVAADKGTADFSDIANGVAQDYGFWLGDGFASGGSNGYDHKAMGITAKGGWEAVKRHFREIGRDIQTEPFTAIGVGDMSGDVFGNGMLLSKQTKLVAAFDHRDIFIDPDPDPAKSWDERKRLFDTPRTSWQDYDKDLISKGGGVFSRQAKSIDLTPEIRELLGIENEKVTPTDLMKAILRSEAELLWFGGIGTYIKSSDESHLDAGDHANDVLRIDARELRAKVIGEGANLGCTQRARIEYAREGGRVNMDAVDNSAGVDCSDHEVNIKILLEAARAEGHIDEEERVAILEQMTDEVGDLVLENNYDQTNALTLAQLTAESDRDAHGRLMRALERDGRLAREIEYLPSEDQLQELAEAGKGLSRPELAILMSYTKTALSEELLASNVPDDPHFDGLVMAYFPKILQERFGDLILKHRLRRDIIATTLANEMIEVGGITFIHRLNEVTGAAWSDIARAFVITYDLFRVKIGKERINELDNKVSAQVQTRMLHDIQTFVRKVVTWVLRQGNGADIATTIDRYNKGVQIMYDAPRTIVSGYEIDAIEARVRGYLDHGVPEDLANIMGPLLTMSVSCDVIDIAKKAELGIEDVAKAYFCIGGDLRLDRVIAVADELSAAEHWDRLAIKRLTGDFAQYQRILTGLALCGDHVEVGQPSETRLITWEEEFEPQLSNFKHFLGELEAQGGLTISKLTLIGSQLRDLVSALSRDH